MQQAQREPWTPYRLERPDQRLLFSVRSRRLTREKARRLAAQTDQKLILSGMLLVLALLLGAAWPVLSGMESHSAGVSNRAWVLGLLSTSAGIILLPWPAGQLLVHGQLRKAIRRAYPELKKKQKG